MSPGDLKLDFNPIESPHQKNRDIDLLPRGALSTRDTALSVVENEPGQPLYNRQIYGGLRKGDTVKFFSIQCIGLVAATFSTTFAAECIGSEIRPLLKEHFHLTSAQLAASERLASMPLVLSFLFGLLTDCYPILGMRRKAYTAIGLAIATVSIWGLAATNSYIETLEDGTVSTRLVAIVITVATLANFGTIVAFVSVHTRVIELTQKEPLGLRGSILATYLIFRGAVFFITDACIYAVQSSTKEAASRHTTALVVFGLIIALPIPLVTKFWEEKYYSLSTTVKTRGQILWKIMQQKAVWSVLVFQCFFTLFNQISFNGPSMIISDWAGASRDNVLMQQAMYYGMVIITVLMWRYFFMNRSWRGFYAACPLLLIVPQLIVAILVSQDILRDRVFYRVMTLFTSISGAIGWLSSLVPLTEIVQEGSEGAMVGLTLSLYFLVSIFVETNSLGLFEGSNFYNVAEVAADSSAGREDVLKALALNYGINALALLGLFFLPKQKLDTQQLRSYGGYTKCASAAIVAFSAVLFLYSFATTIMTFIPGASCLRILGGSGCS
ncbi:Transmembrane protein [Phytophthora cinnamomi]|uniref:Transmembrane protein n=1 Tax=Phytophthora cinnamomi TaxID=4785 RepID=UPI00355AC6AE|nr:Transmembrane protein [Phytophthora cinnamomi]